MCCSVSAALSAKCTCLDNDLVAALSSEVLLQHAEHLMEQIKRSRQPPVFLHEIEVGDRYGLHRKTIAAWTADPATRFLLRYIIRRRIYYK
jgi:hypothetical protein